MQAHNEMEVTFLGTGTSTGVPVVACNCDVCKSQDKRDTRLRTSVMVSINGHNLIVDCGPDFRYQMIRENVEDICAILFTSGFINPNNIRMAKRVIKYNPDNFL